MKNKLTDLNNYLFAQIERLDDESLSEDEMKKEIERSRAIASISNSIVQNANTVLKAAKFLEETGSFSQDTESEVLKLVGK